MRDSDTQLAMILKREIINKNISLDTCKECIYIDLRKSVVNCNNDNPNTHTCNLLKLHRFDE